ncbi:MAG TPA: YihY/virulence factor BrkB family protein [Terriglobales bacterium]|nr:YihY/virulence factor BrkB family protein [Terriglobales bacterium]
MSTSAKPSLWKLGGLTPVALGKQVYKDVGEDEVSVRSAALAYYFVLAVFPAMLFVLSILGFFAGAGTQLRQSLFTSLAHLLPGSASDLIHKTLDEVTRASGAGKAIFGILGALWSASSGVSAVMESLNIAYDVKEDRPLWKQRAVAVGLTLALAVLVLGALGLTLYGADAADWLGAHVGLGSVLVVGWKILQWPVVIAFIFAAFATTYYFAPNLEEPEWHWITPGSALGLIFWLVASFAFKLYLHFFNSYSKTYGSVGAVIILLLWLYITGFAILVGGEVNSAIGRAADAQQEYEERHRRIQQELRAA